MTVSQISELQHAACRCVTHAVHNKPALVSLQGSAIALWMYYSHSHCFTLLATGHARERGKATMFNTHF
jgi:hypothetical protein